MRQFEARYRLNRRRFLGTTGGALTAAWARGVVPLAGAPAASHAAEADQSPQAKKKIPIGVFDPVYEKLSLDEMLDKVSALGLEAMEIGTGGYPNNKHCPLDELIADKSKARAWQKKFEDKGIHVATLSCHGNPVHPNAEHAAKDKDTF